MSAPERPDVTSLLVAWSEGDESALAGLVPLVYDELHRLARHYMRSERPGRTLQTTALIHEAYLRLVDTSRTRWESRSHFLGVAAQAMRRVLVDTARARGAGKRGGGALRLPIESLSVMVPEADAEIIAVHDALEALAQTDPRKARVVELRYFGGFTVAEAAEVLQISPETVNRDWQMAKLWLMRELSSKR